MSPLSPHVIRVWCSLLTPYLCHWISAFEILSFLRVTEFDTKQVPQSLQQQAAHRATHTTEKLQSPSSSSSSSILPPHMMARATSRLPNCNHPILSPIGFFFAPALSSNPLSIHRLYHYFTCCAFLFHFLLWPLLSAARTLHWYSASCTQR